jgi:hypothetical protein
MTRLSFFQSIWSLKLIFVAASPKKAAAEHAKSAKPVVATPAKYVRPLEYL